MKHWKSSKLLVRQPQYPESEFRRPRISGIAAQLKPLVALDRIQHGKIPDLFVRELLPSKSATNSSLVSLATAGHYSQQMLKNTIISVLVLFYRNTSAYKLMIISITTTISCYSSPFKAKNLLTILCSSILRKDIFRALSRQGFITPSLYFSQWYYKFFKRYQPRQALYRSFN